MSGNGGGSSERIVVHSSDTEVQSSISSLSNREPRPASYTPYAPGASRSSSSAGALLERIEKSGSSDAVLATSDVDALMANMDPEMRELRKRNGRRNVVACLLGTLAVGGAATILGVMWGTRYRETHVSTASGAGGDLRGIHGGGGEPSPSPLPLPEEIPPPPHNLNELCGPDSLATLDGFRECEQACVVRTCCVAKEDGTPGSCAADNEEVCQLYEICDVLDSAPDGDSDGDSDGNGDDTGDVVTATFVADTCSVNNVQEEQPRHDCAELCSDHMCCFELDDNCATQSDKDCVTYDACKNLLIHEEPIVVTSQDVDKQCDATAMKDDSSIRADCTTLCSEHMCCFEADSNCQGEEGKDCATYASCKNLLGEEEVIGGDVVTEVTKEEINDKCSHTSIANGDLRNECAELCSDHMCCFQQDDDCSESPQKDCTKYASCKHLLVNEEGDINEDVTKQEVDDKCSTASVKDEDVRMECADLCSEHMCCFQEDDTCADNPTKDCSKYESCKNLYPVTSRHVDAVCSADNTLDVGGSREECAELCSDHMCCFEEDTACLEGSDCAIYNSCKNLLVTDQSASLSDATGDAPIEETVAEEEGTRTTIDDLCSMANLADETSRNACAEACSDHMCCFERDDDCSNDPAKECPSHSACENLLLLTDQDVHHLTTRQEVEEACDEDRLGDADGMARDACAQICSTHFCCFEEDDNCAAEEGKDCDSFDLCKVLLTQ